MPTTKGKHLDLEDCLIIEEGLENALSARALSRRLHVSTSTVTREIKANRCVKVPKRKNMKPSTRCIHYNECQKSGSACEKCFTKLTSCKHCKTRACIDRCEDFKLTLCPKTMKWPYVCSKGCPKRQSCNFSKCSYRAESAQSSYEQRLRLTRRGPDITDEELKRALEIIKPLVDKGQSFEAIWATHADELPMCVRTFYSYVDD